MPEQLNSKNRENEKYLEMYVDEDGRFREDEDEPQSETTTN